MSIQSFREKHSHCSNESCGRKLGAILYVLNDNVLCEDCYTFVKKVIKDGENRPLPENMNLS